MMSKSVAFGFRVSIVTFYLQIKENVFKVLWVSAEIRMEANGPIAASMAAAPR